MTTHSSAEVAATYALPESLVAAAMAKLNDGEAHFLAVSGKLGSGKDTVAPLVMDGLGVTSVVHEFFARPLKEEVDQVIGLILRASSEAEAVALVESELKPVNHEQVVAVLYDDVKAGLVTSAYVRTPSSRTALQLWGTEVRRTQDVDYWVKKAMASAVAQLAAGKSVFVTDARFPNEVDAIRSMPSTVARITVTPETQAARIMKRDGIPPTPESLLHVSETALDDYDFPLVIPTDSMDVDEVVGAIVEHIEG